MKRLVFIHTQGPHAGLHQILGVADEFPEGAEKFEAMGRVVEFASLIKMTTRAAFYREVIKPMSFGSFDPRQR